MVTIKTLKDFIKRSFPHLTDEEIEKARIIINSKVSITMYQRNA